MIKILSTGTSAAVYTGVNAKRRLKGRGHFGEGTKRCEFLTAPLHLQGIWDDRILKAAVTAGQSLYIRRVSFTFRIRSPKPLSRMVVWTESYGDGFRSGVRRELPGVQTGKKSRGGCWGMWLAESEGREGIFLGQPPPLVHPVSFECRPPAGELTVSWTVNRQLDEGASLHLSVMLRRGERERCIEGWRKLWTGSPGSVSGRAPRNVPGSAPGRAPGRIPSADRRRGWMGGDELSSPGGVGAAVSRLRALKIPLDWFAVGPNYAARAGDWLESAEKFQDRMGSVSRSIGEANFIPGLRFAPFLVSKNSWAAKERRDWLVGAANGAPVTVRGYASKNDALYVLDVTNDEVIQHVRNILVTMRSRWGFRVFIIERFSDALLPGKRKAAQAGPGVLMERAGRVIREAVGGKVLLIGSSVPLLGTSGVWDAVFTTPPPEAGMPPRHLADLSSGIIHRSMWNRGTWINAAGPLPLDFFRRSGDAVLSFRRAALMCSGMVVLGGDPRELTEADASNLLEFFGMFSECRGGRLSLGGRADGGRSTPLVVRNTAGWVGLFNFAGKKRSIRLDRDSLKSAHGITGGLSARNGAVFNSPEIHVSLPPWGQRLFRG